MKGWYDRLRWWSEAYLHQSLCAASRGRRSWRPWPRGSPRSSPPTPSRFYWSTVRAAPGRMAATNEIHEERTWPLNRYFTNLGTLASCNNVPMYSPHRSIHRALGTHLSKSYRHPSAQGSAIHSGRPANSRPASTMRAAALQSLPREGVLSDGFQERSCW